jgi:predicted nucleic acid-binding protein
MKLYLDASVLVRLLNDELELPRVSGEQRLLVSSFAVGEVGSVFSRLVSMGEMPADAADVWLAEFDLWCEQATSIVDTDAADIRAASRLVRRYPLQTKLPDTIHLVLAERHSATLVTADRKLAAAARQRDALVELI